MLTVRGSPLISRAFVDVVKFSVYVSVDACCETSWFCSGGKSQQTTTAVAQGTVRVCTASEYEFTRVYIVSMVQRKCLY